MLDVKFAEGELWEPDRRNVSFDAYLDGSDRHITCEISSEVLRDKFGAPSGEKKILLTTFRQNRSRIEEIAIRLIQSASNEQDGTILIRGYETGSGTFSRMKSPLTLPSPR